MHTFCFGLKKLKESELKDYYSSFLQKQQQIFSMIYKKEITSLDYDVVDWAMIGLQKSHQRLLKVRSSVQAFTSWRIYIYIYILLLLLFMSFNRLCLTDDENVHWNLVINYAWWLISYNIIFTVYLVIIILCKRRLLNRNSNRNIKV